MTVTASTRPADQRAGALCRPGDDSLRIAALQVLQSSGYAALRRLRCEVTVAVLTVYGTVPSYFLKQMAQAVLLRLDGIRGVRNLVEVQVADDLPGWRPHGLGRRLAQTIDPSGGGT